MRFTPAPYTEGYPTERRTRARAILRAMFARYDIAWVAAERDRLMDSLFADAGDGTGWLAGISELSVSLRRGESPAIRCLSEIVQRRPLRAALAAAGLAWGRAVLRALASLTDASYAAALFEDVYGSLYPVDERGGGARSFRFGCALELSAAIPTMKAYFDLHATRPEDRPRALARFQEMVQGAPASDLWRASFASSDDAIRVIGVDFRADGSVRSKLYAGARNLSWRRIAHLSHEISGPLHVETIECLRAEIGDGSDAMSATQISLVSEGGARSMKIDVCLPRLFEDDERAFAAIERFRTIAVGDHGATPVDVVTGGVAPRATRSVQQVLGVELPAGAPPKVTVYYRPMGFETAHLSATLRPRMRGA